MTHPHAIAAVNAAKNFKNWGRYAALRYCEKRGVPLRLLTLARVLQTAKENGL